MKLLRFQQQSGENRVGVMLDDSHFVEVGIRVPSPEPLLAFLALVHEKAGVTSNSASKQWKNDRRGNKHVFSTDDVSILPPIGHPSKIICMGGNFSDHLTEGGASRPPFPISFLKSPTALTGHRTPVVYPPKVKLLDYEVELATVIGKRCKNVSKDEAMNYVAGFSVFNDISARDIQFAEMKRGFCNMGKNFESFAPMGPSLVTPDQVGDPDDLEMELRVNGQTRQMASTRRMIFKVRELVEWFSAMTLEPGDVITSGTPSGVAIYRKPNREQYLLKPGDFIESKVAGLGMLKNTVIKDQ